MKTFTVTSDANLDIDFAHVFENPAIKGIEILRPDTSASQLAAFPSSVAFDDVAVNGTDQQSVQLVNSGAVRRSLDRHRCDLDRRRGRGPVQRLLQRRG